MATVLIPDFSIDTDPDLEIAAAGPHRVIVHRTRDPDAVPLADWQAADALVCHHLMPMGAAMVERARNCRVLVRAGVGYDHIDVPAWRAAGVPVCNVPDYGTTDIADFAMALLLCLARGIVPYHTGLVTDPVGNWRARHPSPTVRRLKGLNCLVVGLGAIGMAFARRAAAADMQVGYFDPYRPNAIALGLGYTKFETLTDAMAWADVVSVHCLLSAETRHLINAEALAAARPGLILINTARGGCVDLSAVVTALEDGRLAGCGLDVLEQEPPDPSHPFLQGLTSGRWDGRVLLTPHSAFNSPQAGRDMRVKAIETARAFLETGVLRNPIGG